MRSADAAEPGERLRDANCLDRGRKRPKAYRVVEGLPKNNYGKVMKTNLSRIVGEGCGVTFPLASVSARGRELAQAGGQVDEARQGGAVGERRDDHRADRQRREDRGHQRDRVLPPPPARGADLPDDVGYPVVAFALRRLSTRSSAKEIDPMLPLLREYRVGEHRDRTRRIGPGRQAFVNLAIASGHGRRA